MRRNTFSAGPNSNYYSGSPITEGIKFVHDIIHAYQKERASKVDLLEAVNVLKAALEAEINKDRGIGNLDYEEKSK